MLPEASEREEINSQNRNEISGPNSNINTDRNAYLTMDKTSNTDKPISKVLTRKNNQSLPVKVKKWFF